MFRVDDLVVYGSSGVCKIIDISNPAQAAHYTDKLYYKLQPVFGSETIFTPVDTAIFIRPVISKEDAQKLMAKIPSIREEVYVNKNLTVLTAHYKEALQEYECEDLVRIIKSVRVKNKTAVANGKKPGQIDQRYMKRAESLLCGELSVALGISRDEVQQQITDTIKKTEEA